MLTKKITALVLVLFLMYSIILPTIPAYAAEASDATNSIEKSGAKTVSIAKAERNYFLKDKTGKQIGGTYWEYTADTGVVGPAYCVAHGLKAVTGGKTLPIKERYDASPKTMGAFANGYPQVELADFIAEHGTTGLTESEYGYATQLAVWATLGQLGVAGTVFTQGREQIVDPGSSDPQQSRVFKALQAILAGANTWDRNQYRGMFSRYQEDKNGDTLEMYSVNGFEGLAQAGKIAIETINGTEYYTIPWFVSSATPTKPYGNIITVTAYDAPSGTILVGTDNTLLDGVLRSDDFTSYKVPTEKRNTNLNANGVEYLGKFKIAIPANPTPPLSGNISLISYTEMTQYEMYIAHNADNTEQSYMIADPAVGKTYGSGKLIWSSDETEPTEARLEVTKTGGMGEPLQGATFELRDGDTIIDTQTTGADGKAVFESLDADKTYTLVETVAPAGYALAAPISVTTQQNVTTYATIPNDNAKKFRVRKVDKQDGLVLEGAIFEFEQIDDGHKTSGATKFDGVIEFNGQELPFGSYIVRELNPPAGYLKDTKEVTVEWTGAADVELNFTNVRIPGIILNKVAEDGKPLADAVFDIFKDGQKVDSVTTGETGSVRINCGLGEGYYEAQETSAPTGYILDTTKHGIYLDPYDPAVENDPVITVINKARAQLQILKIDANTSDPIAGVTFEVYRDTKLVGSYITDAAGEIKFDNRKRPKLEILKVDTVTRQPLAGAKFKVTQTEDKTVSEYETDASGRILIENLDEVIYTVEEITAPNGYILDTQHKEIALEWGKTKTLIYENMRKPTLIVTKINALTYLPIPETTYFIQYEAAGGGVVPIGTYRTDVNGQIALPKVNAGWYIITETIPAPGFSLSTTPVTRKYLAPGENAYTNFGVGGTGGDTSGDNITVTSGDDYITSHDIINYPLNSIVLRKVDAVTGELLPGAVFELRKVSEDISGTSGTIIGRYTTNNSGTIVISGLIPGGYIATEVKAPDDYLLSENSQQQAWLKPDGTSIVELTFANYPFGGILITKVDAVTNKPLKNARFRVTDSSGAVLGETNGEYITNENGEIAIPDVKPGSYVITEIEAPPNYTIDTTPQTVTVETTGKMYKVNFKNQPAGTLTILKYDTATREPLEGAEFMVTDSSGAVVGNGNGKYTTDATGQIVIPNLPKGSYIVRETKAPTDYILENQQQTIAVDYGQTYTLEFFNKHMSGLQIIKIDKQTKQPIKGAEFAVYKQSGEMIGRYTTDADGVIIIDTLETGWYKAVETKATDGYILDDTPQDFQITANQFIKLVFENAPLSGLIIRKVDADTRDPLEGAEFTVKSIGGLLIGVYRSDTDGLAHVGTLDPGWYEVTETKAPDGYTLGDNVQKVEIKHTQMVVLEFQNRAFGSLVIKKVDEITGAPLIGATFEVQKQGGGFVGEYTTGVDGTVNIPSLSPGWYVVSETKAPAGYTLDSTAKTVEVKPVVPSVVTFTNKPHSGIEIIKLDTQTNAPLSGAAFLVERVNGERIGSYETDSTGKIIVPDLTEGTYIVSETAAPDGYILDEAPKTVTVKSGRITTVEFFNKPLSGLKIIKLDSATRQPIAGVEFAVTKMTGEKVTNAFNGTTFVTDKTGQIYIPLLEDGYYNVTETRSADGYILDAEPKTVLVESGKPTVLEVLNAPMSGLLIVKTDETTGKPLQGVIFDVRRADGQFVASSILDGNQPNTEANSPNKTISPNGDITGSYTTDANGRIQINGLPAGEYHVTERKALAGYELDTDIHAATVVPGKVTTLQLTNKQKASLMIEKTDSVTGKGIYGVTFILYDEGKSPVMQLITDQNGTAWVDKELAAGKYFLREFEAAEGYEPDNEWKTIYIEAGKTTQVSWQNKPITAQIQIIKYSSEYNSVTGTPAGSLLKGAVFEITRARSGVVVGYITTDARGVAASEPLPLGRYYIQEVTAPPYYQVSAERMETELEYPGQIIRMSAYNKSANLGTEIKKVGNNEVIAGDSMRYDITVKNTSNVSLSDFYWSDRLPTDAVRGQTLSTGTYNQRVYYRIMYKTNNSEWSILAANLLSTNNYSFNISASALGLMTGEVVTDIKLEFGTVAAGFASLTKATINVQTDSKLAKGYQIINRCEVGGQYGGAPQVSTAAWLTKVVRYGATPTLPKTGY